MATTPKLSVVSCTDQRDGIVTLNIGGQIYSTKRSTITDNVDSQSFLSLLIQNRTNISLNEHGQYFIDRDGRYFSYILNYFREKKVRLPKNDDQLKQLFLEAKFYQIDRLINEIENRRNENHQRDRMSCRLTVVSKLNEDQRILKLIGPLKFIVLFKIQSIGERFLKIISSFNDPENILCQFTFPFDEKLISCQPLDQLQKFVLAKQAKKMGLIVSYSEDYFYLPIERRHGMSREEFSYLISNKYNGKLLNSNIISDDSYNLVENWLLVTSSDETDFNASLTSVH